MSLFFRVETKSKLLGASENDIVVIAADRVTRITSSSDGGCIIHDDEGNRTRASVSVEKLFLECVLDIAESS